MSGTSDKARFYMEQAVPQLQEFQQNNIFSSNEIKNLVKKRSDFEHKVLARGSTPEDFIKYINWEIQLETLRAKRCKRMRIKQVTAQAGQSRILSLFARATKKHYGDFPLWMNYLKYCRTIKSTKRFKTTLTDALRMHCTKTALWLYAAKYAVEEESDFGAARSYMQRGQRFCTNPDLWIEYAKLEMMVLPTVTQWREKILGLEVDQQMILDEDADEGDDLFGANGDTITLSTTKAHKLRDNFMEDEKRLQASLPPALNKALNGAIPLLIFADAQTQPFYNAAVAESFFNMFASFKHVHCQANILSTTLEHMKTRFPNEAATGNCVVRFPIIGLDPKSIEFSEAFADDVLVRLKEAMASTKDRELLAKKTVAWMMPILRVEGLDDGFRSVVDYTLRDLA